MEIARLVETAKQLVSPTRGILAADESSGTIERRFASINVESTERNRRDYREMLFRTPGIVEYISGVILFDETIRQTAADDTKLVKVLQGEGLIPGIKVDRGTGLLPGSHSELITEGLDGLRERLVEYRELGARFTKWRAVIRIGANLPSAYCIEANAHALARFAALSQEAGLVPIVEPEVLIDGDHDIDRFYSVSEASLQEVFIQLHRQGVLLEGMLLKPSMVTSGKEGTIRAKPDEVAEKTLACLMRTVPAAVPGIVFLSGGQSDLEATANLNEINLKAATAGTPWQLSFSYGRALQGAPLRAWGGDSENVQSAQSAFYSQAHVVSLARQGYLQVETANHSQAVISKEGI